MKSRYHILLSLIISITLFIMVKDLFAAITCFISGVFIDVDHLVDYWMLTGKLTRSTSELMETIEPYDLIFIPLHSWEILLTLMLLTPLYPILYGSTIGFLFHMIADLAFNHAKIEGYLFMYRVNQNWRKESVFTNYYPNQEQ